ncbi:hypothetical protein [Acidisphaera rubrifaciens]|uniref:Yip1 domain-containing protein n=1 Tax=Acidisphaera rubrifaciens HS-AP3 TaxID=1231350 RepID=A0A0D6P9V6_9PROT|nr:hypothetical protein [Acidisphaera rubrifaciens]GAN77988.1 hypothetical protein Asru_0554_03 [Acidisphaera rubrifaciens HS-AP3]
MSGPVAPPRRNVLRGIVLCAIGRREGLEWFGDTRHAFISSLLPLLLFPLLRAVLLPPGQSEVPRGTLLLATITVVLASAVLSHLMATWFRREPLWLRYATAVNWTTWVLQLAVLLAIVATAGLASAGLPPTVALIACFAAVGLYGLWLQWFLARHGLRLGPGRALLVVLAVNAGAAALVAVPEVALREAMLLNGPAPVPASGPFKT